MSTQARITSTEALDSFRAKLIVFLGKAQRSVNDVSEEVHRTRQWLQHDRRVYWEGELRRQTRLLEQAQQELFSVKLSSLHQESALHTRQAAVKRAKQSLNEAEDKIRNVKRWNQNFDSCIDPSVKELERLREFLEKDIPQAISYLTNTQKILEAYTERTTPSLNPQHFLTPPL